MEQSISFEIKAESLALAQSATIDANFVETEKALREMMLPYKNLVMTDMTTAKNARAEVNKVKKSIDDSRKTVKKLWSTPLLAFEERCKTLTGICDEASGAIDAQIKAEEQKEKDIRISTLRNFFNSSSHDVADYITFERIYNPKWETKSYGMERAEQEIAREIENTASNVETIKAMNSPFETALLLVLQETGDMGKVLQKKMACEAIEAKKVERMRAVNDTAEKVVEEPTHTETPTHVATNKTEEKIYTFTLEFKATKEQAFMIDDFFKKNNIKYRKVKL